MSTDFSRRAIVAGAASVPALAVPAVAAEVFTTDPGRIALGERLKVLMPRVAALGLKWSALREEALRGFPQCWGKDKQASSSSSGRVKPAPAAISHNTSVSRPQLPLR
jgi:hypothetical protein